MRVLLSTRKMLDDMVGYNEVEALVWKREFRPEHLTDTPNSPVLRRQHRRRKYRIRRTPTWRNRLAM
jgi:hypothetical protein